MTIRDLVLAARARLAAAGIDANEAAMDAALLARHALGWDQARLVAHFQAEKLKQELAKA